MTTTDVVGIIETGNELHFVFANGLTDGTTEAEVKILDLGGSSVSVGNHLKGKTITRMAFQPSDGSILQLVKLYAPDGAILFHAVGCERTSNQRAGIDVRNLRIRVKDGALLKMYTTD